MKKIILVILIILVITVFTVVLYNKNNPRVTFEATIEEIIEYNGKYTFCVSGLDDNDDYHKDKFTFLINDEIKLKQGKNDLEIGDFKEGQKVLITYDGLVYTSYPPQISNVLKVELFEK